MRHSTRARASKPEKIPRPRNCFFIFRNDQEKILRIHDPKATNASLSQQIAELWRNKSPAVEAEYRERARIEVQEHRAKYPNYKYAPKTRKKRKAEAAQESAESQDSQQDSGEDISWEESRSTFFVPPALPPTEEAQLNFTYDHMHSMSSTCYSQNQAAASSSNVPDLFYVGSAAEWDDGSFGSFANNGVEGEPGANLHVHLEMGDLNGLQSGGSSGYEANPYLDGTSQYQYHGQINHLANTFSHSHPSLYTSYQEPLQNQGYYPSFIPMGNELQPPYAVPQDHESDYLSGFQYGGEPFQVAGGPTQTPSYPPNDAGYYEYSH